MSEDRREDKTVQAAAQQTTEIGNRDRMEHLFREHHKQVFHAAYRITGNSGDAEDAMQTVFMRLLRRTGPVLSEDPGSYLHRAAVNAALDILRSRRSDRSTPLDDVASVLADEESPGPERHAGDRQIRDLIRDALGRLSPKTAEAFALRYFEGYGNHEIARMMGTSRSTVGVMLHRARHTLRNEIRSLQETRHG